jgi:hypothetical protein
MGNTTLLAILLGVLLLVSGLAVGYIAMPEKVVTNTITAEPVEVTSVEYNDTAIKADIAAIQNTLDEDDLWEAEAIKLAEAEYTNRHLYNALIDLNVTDLDDKDDITKFVVRDTDVSGADATDKDADVEQEVRIYYENSVGDDVRITLIITTEIVENEVEDTDYALA